jgi:negative regulator of sigma E activity
MLQEAGVAVIVLAAVVFLVRQFTGGSRKPKKAQTFVPLSKLKKKPDDHCH